VKPSILLTVFFWAILFGTSEAVIYKYVDDDGKVHYTNDLSQVPADKLNDVSESEETESNNVAPAPSYSGPIYPLLQDSQSPEELARQQAQAEKKAQLEAEYQTLLEEKEALDNNESFQKRRNKRKYQNRPYIKELVAEEARIKQRLMQVKRELKKYQ
jgi:hypothetical protein